MATILAVRACATQMERPHSDQVAIQLEREGPRVRQDGQLGQLLAGNLAVTDRAVRAAYCVNGWYWATDVTLNRQIVVGTNGRFVRAAELVASGAFDRELVEAIETELLSLDDGEVNCRIAPTNDPGSIR